VVTPEVSLPAPAAAGPGVVRRSRRDWAVDVACFLLAAAFGVSMSASLTAQPLPPAVMLVEQVGGAVGCAALWLRRRWPAGVAVALASFSLLVQGAMSIALFGVAVHRRFPVAVAVGAATMATAPVYALLRPDPEMPYLVAVLLSVAIYSTVLGWGMLVRSRRQVLAHLRERAERAEAEALLRAEHIRRAERERIARDIHDTLAHRLSLLSMSAGALEFRSDVGGDAATDEQRRAAGIIREHSHLALQDVREVLGVLRAPVGPDLCDGPGLCGGPGRPPPGLAGISDLVADARSAGMDVTVDVTVDVGPEEGAEVPARVGRTAYRVVQEGLTNARKHAPGAAVSIQVGGSRATGLRIRVRNGPPPRTASGDPPAVPGTGRGIAGLRERVALAGGDLAAGPSVDGWFELTATLPWDGPGVGEPG
jgi:signal transduction histidine kinase